jgi:phosphoribosylformylglycinamidine cyclo-ligase
MEGITYRDSGVDIDVADATKAILKDVLRTDNPRVLNELGAYGSLFDARFPGYEHPVLVLKTEEPGSKQLLAFAHDRVESVCFDMINHLINDCIALGAKPLCVQDCVVCGKLQQDIVVRIVSAIADACREQECVLTGGEISEQPGVLDEGQYVLTSSIVGVVEKSEIIDGSAMQQGDVVLALESSGVHTNGFTLIRALIARDPDLPNRQVAGKSFLDDILTPHRCYYHALKDLKYPLIRGIAHITGGGIRDNLRRIIPEHLGAEIDRGLYEILPVFRFIRDAGNVADSDMIRTFNLGVGVAVVTSPEDEASVREHVESTGVKCYPIGGIAEGEGDVTLTGQLTW